MNTIMFLIPIFTVLEFGWYSTLRIGESNIWKSTKHGDIVATLYEPLANIGYLKLFWPISLANNEYLH